MKCYCYLELVYRQVKSVKTIIKLTFDGCHNVLILGCTYCLPLTAPTYFEINANNSYSGQLYSHQPTQNSILTLEEKVLTNPE